MRRGQRGNGSGGSRLGWDSEVEAKLGKRKYCGMVSDGGRDDISRSEARRGAVERWRGAEAS